MQSFLKNAVVFAGCAMAVDIVPETRAEGISCLTMDTSDFAYWDMGELTRQGGYSQNGVTFNFCQYADWPEADEDNHVDTFAYFTGALGKHHALTLDNSLKATDVKSHSNGADSYVEMNFDDSKSVCVEDESKVYSLTYLIFCDKSVTGQGEAQINFVDNSDCHVTVSVRHNAGCPHTLPFIEFVQNNRYLLGAVLVAAGVFVGLFGKRYFGEVLQVVTFLFMFFFGMIAVSLFGWTESTVGFWVCILVCLGVACGSAYMITRPCTAKVIFFAFGALAGFFLGVFIYTTILALIGSGPAWLMIAFGILGAVGIAFLAAKNRYYLVLIGTSVIGSYWFTRGMGNFFGNYPNESEIWTALNSGADLDAYLNDWFWIYFGTFIAALVISLVYQFNDENSAHVMLSQDENFQSQERATKEKYGRKKVDGKGTTTPLLAGQN